MSETSRSAARLRRWRCAPARAALASGLSTAEVADAVVSGIRDGRFYIVPAQPNLKEEIRRRGERLAAEENPPVGFRPL